MLTKQNRPSFSWVQWAALVGLSLALFLIAGVIVLALIPLYLPRAGRNLELPTTDRTSNDYILNYKTNFQSGNNGTYEVSDLNALTQSLNQNYGFSPNFIQGQSARFVTDKNQQRRRRRHSESCQGDTSNLNGDLLTIRFQGQYPSVCASIETCIDAYLTRYLNKIRSSLAEFSLPVPLRNQGIRTITAAFCSLEQIDLVHGTWTVANKMSTARTNSPAVKLANDRILVSGGIDSSSTALSSSEIFTPSSSSWTSTGAMAVARHHHTMTLLANGNEVLVTGGENNGLKLSSAELYNINSGTWSPTSKPMPDTHVAHTSTLLNNGRVLLAGGVINTSQTAVYYDPTTSDWVQTGNMFASYREGATATLLNDGRVLVTGGATAAKFARNTAEIYNPTTNSWTQTSGNMISTRFYHSAVRLSDGNVLIVGGRNAFGEYTSSAELYVPSSDSFIAIDSPTYGGTQLTLTSLPNNFILLTPGGDEHRNCPVLSELYDSTTRKWMKTGFLNIGRQANFVFPISNRVLTCGGDNVNGALDSCEYLSFS